MTKQPQLESPFEETGMKLYRTLMNEWSLLRAYSQFQNAGHHSFAIIAAYRAGASQADNVANIKWLKATAEDWIALSGFGTEGREVFQETGLWINGLPLTEAHKLAHKCGQAFFIYGGPDTKGEVTLFNHRGSAVQTFPHFSPAAIAQFYSKWRGRSFHFEWQPGSVIGNENIANKKRLRKFVAWLMEFEP